jgi:hypothetical protein
MRLQLICVLSLMVAAACAQTAQPAPALATFSLTETFGVAHPDQLLTFDLKVPVEPAQTVLIVEDGQGGGVAVPYQLVAGGEQLAVRTSLAAGERKSFSLRLGTPAALPAGGVTVTETPGYFEIANGLTGVRVPKAVAALVPGQLPSPVQGVRLRDGAWTATGGRLAATVPDGLTPRMSVTFLERGPLKTVVQVRYDFAVLPAPPAAPPTPRCSTTTIEVQAGQPSILFEEETDLPRSYGLELYPAVRPTHARYRGHHADSKAAGYEPDGQMYRQWHQRPALDAQVDLTYGSPRSYGRIARWDPWIANTGWYWQLFDGAAGPEGNLVGVFAGRASRQIGSTHSGVESYTAPAGMADLVSAVDARGNLHAVYVGGGALWLLSCDATLAPGKPVKIAEGLMNPDLVTLADGALSVIAYDPQTQGFVEVHGRAGEAFTRQPVVLADAGGVTVGDPYAYQAARGDAHFLFFYGDRQGKREGLLFSRAPDETVFTFRSALGELGYYRHINRSCFAALPDGRIRLLTTNKGGYATVSTIAPAGLTLSPPAEMPDGRVLNFGAALDPLTGGYAVSDHEGKLHDYPAAGAPRSAPLDIPRDHHGQGANRRMVATSPDGTAVLLHGGNSDNAYTQSVFRGTGGAWAAWPAASALGMACTRVHYHAPSGQFVVLGRKDGKLTAYSCKPAELTPTPLFVVAETEVRRAGFSVVAQPSTPASPRTRFQWGLFVGTKGADLKPAVEIQPIARQLNLHGGINLDKIQRYTLDFPDPAQGYGAMYMPKPAVTSLIAKLRADKSGIHGGGFHSWLYNAEPMGRQLIDLWADTTGEKAARLTSEIIASGRTLLDQFVNGDGIYAMPTHYWHGGLEMSRKLVWLDGLLGAEGTSPEEKRRLKAVAVLFGSILFDNDFVPLDNHLGINLGTPNMPVQQQNYRQMYALLLANHPMMRERVKNVAGAARSMLQSTVNEHGAHMGSLHYVGAANGPLLATFQQLQRAGVYDAFAQEERLERFAEFYLQALTPPEVRFGGLRRMVAIGDGATEGTEEYGMLGTGYATAKPALSQRLMGAWRENGKVHTGFHGSTLLKIDDTLPGVTPNLGDAKFPGYYSILRSGWGTPLENAVWCVNGNFYVDHCHNDLGALTLYLLGAPVSVDWGSLYTPRVSGGAMHSTVIQESAFGQAWDKDVANFDSGVGFSGHYGNHGVGEATAVDTYPDGKRMISTLRSGLRDGGKPENITTWVRTVSLVTADPKLPVLLIRDTFSGKEAAVPKIWTLNLMADGVVETPAGPQTPPQRTHPYADKATDPATQLPSAGPVFPLAAGTNRLGFTGQTWKGHPSGGIDWDVYLLPDAPQQAQLGNWANQSSPSAHEFERAQGRKYEERQHILRVRGTGEFVTVIVPWPKGAKPEGLSVTREGELIAVRSAGREIRFRTDGTW